MNAKLEDSARKHELATPIGRDDGRDRRPSRKSGDHAETIVQPITDERANEWLPNANLQPNETVPTPRLTLTVGEAAAVLGISRAFAYELVARGELPAVKLGRRIVVPRRVLDSILGSGTWPAA